MRTVVFGGLDWGAECMKSLTCCFKRAPVNAS